MLVMEVIKGFAGEDPEVAKYYPFSLIRSLPHHSRSITQTSLSYSAMVR